MKIGYKKACFARENAFFHSMYLFIGVKGATCTGTAQVENPFFSASAEKISWSLCPWNSLCKIKANQHVCKTKILLGVVESRRVIYGESIFAGRLILWSITVISYIAYNIVLSTKSCYYKSIA